MKWKRIAVLGACSLAFGVTGYAAGGVESIQAYQNHHIKFVINSSAWTPKDSDGIAAAPVILGGTSYIPTKAAVEALGGHVEWNDASKTIVITSSGETKTSIPDGEKVSEREQLVTKKINEIKEKLKVGLTKEEVAALFQEKYKIAHDNGDLENGSDSFWKYDFFKEPGYNREDIPDHVADEEGLQNKKIGASLFIGWKENTLHFYSISYVNPKDRQVYFFGVHSDGTVYDVPVSSSVNGAENIQAYLNHDIKFTVNGKAWTPQDSDGIATAPVILGGTSYIPTKAAVEALDGHVEWIDATKTIVITSKS